MAGREMPKIEYRLSRCPRCGAATEFEAERLCQPTRDYTDEYSCPGEFNADGCAHEPTRESLAAIDRWCEEQMREDRP